MTDPAWSSLASHLGNLVWLGLGVYVVVTVVRGERRRVRSARHPSVHPYDWASDDGEAVAPGDGASLAVEAEQWLSSGTY